MLGYRDAELKMTTSMGRLFFVPCLESERWMCEALLDIDNTVAEFNMSTHDAATIATPVPVGVSAFSL